MKALVITGGNGPPVEVVRRWADGAQIIVAADSGLDAAFRYGLDPDLAVGDFDSVSGEEVLSRLLPAQVERYPADKDETDTEIGVRVAREHGAVEIVVIGGGGGDMGHFVGILSLFDRDPAPLAWATGTTEFTNVTESVTISGAVGEAVSFFPLGCGPCEMRSQGLRWPLDTVSWRKGDIGVHNELSAPRASVQMLRGRLLMVRALEST